VGVGIEYWAKIKWIGVLIVINGWSVVHQCLLKPDLIAKTFIVTNCPG
jgi:hypothetical protein